jgi:transglutaminase-like putative cysteine protease
MAPLNITLRIGCHVVLEAKEPTVALFMIKPRRDEYLRVAQERFTFSPSLPAMEYEDVHGNIVHRAVLQPGENAIHHDALVGVSSEPDNYGLTAAPVPLFRISPEVLRYTMASRYCDSDKLAEFAQDHFGKIPRGVEQVQAVCDWTHNHIEYRFGSGRADISAQEIVERGYGVCRDFAHVAIALCRALDLPARYVTGHLADVGRIDKGTAMDFHAYFEVFLGTWMTYDARFNVPRIGRVKVAHGLDAVDGAITTVYGNAPLKKFEVWAYQVNPKEVSVGDPIDLSKRLDGTEKVRLS